MGGHQGGDIASAMAVEIIPQTFSTQQEDTPIKIKSLTRFVPPTMPLLTVVQEMRNLKGMGTTAVLAHFMSLIFTLETWETQDVT